MTRNQRGDITLILVAILAVVMIGGVLFYTLGGRTNTDFVSDKPNTSVEKLQDKEGDGLQAEMDEAGKQNLNDAQPTENDLGL